MIYSLLFLFAIVQYVRSANPYVIELESINFGDCVVVDHGAQTGDDHGGIASGPNGDSFIYTGDSDTVLFTINAAGTGITQSTSTNYVAGMFSDLANGQYYSFTTGASLFDESDEFIDGISMISSSGVMTGSVVALSMGVNFTGSSDNMVFADAGYVHLFSDAFGNGHLYSIRLSDGDVTMMAYTSSSTMQNGYYGCETWAAWGFVERDVAGDIAGVLSCSGPASEDGICRFGIGNTNINQISFTEFAYPNGTAVGIYDVCSVTISPAGSAEGRFFFHHEGGSTLHPADETAGFCRAAVTNYDSTPAASSSSASNLQALF